MPTIVIDVRKQTHQYLADHPSFVYVGPRMKEAGWKVENILRPFKARRGSVNGKPETYQRYREHVSRILSIDLRSPRTPRLDAAVAIAFRCAIDEIRGKTLGCRCCDWMGGDEPFLEPCHAIVLAQVADGTFVSETAKWEKEAIEFRDKMEREGWK